MLGDGATIGSEKRLFAAPKTKGSTSVVAQILKAGGENRPIAELKLPDGTKLTARVESVELTQRLGELLYQQVELLGKAVWNSETWKLQDFHVTEIGRYLKHASDPVGALDKLHKASRGLWDKISVSQYFSDLRTPDDGVES